MGITRRHGFARHMCLAGMGASLWGHFQRVHTPYCLGSQRTHANSLILCGTIPPEPHSGLYKFLGQPLNIP